MTCMTELYFTRGSSCLEARVNLAIETCLAIKVPPTIAIFYCTTFTTTIHLQMASIKVGDKIPEDASFFVLKNDAPATVSAAELFPGKKVKKKLAIQYNPFRLQ